MSASPVNVFQQLMRTWEARHPYNAVQAMKLRGTPNVGAWTHAWRDTLAAAGLGPIAIERNRYRFAPLNGTPMGCACPTASLAEHVTAELNAPFGNDAESLPMRPFVLSGDGFFYAGVTYRHWIADSVAMRMLLRDWFVRLHDPARARQSPLRLPRQGYWPTVGPAGGGWSFAESLLALTRRHGRLRRAQKVQSHQLADHRTAFMPIDAPDGLATALLAAARRRGVKVTDLLLAALLQACAAHVPLQRRPSRCDVAVGSAADLRSGCRRDLSNTFGLWLGFLHVVSRPADLRDFDRLVRVVASQTKRAKADGLGAISLSWMGAAAALGRLSRPDELYHFYRKELPLAGGLSNVNLSNQWPTQEHPHRLLEYVRASPTGPMTPVVITTTALGGQLTMGMTHRIGLVSPEVAMELGQMVVRRLMRVV